MPEQWMFISAENSISLLDAHNGHDMSNPPLRDEPCDRN
jgi:hypothetical protein